MPTGLPVALDAMGGDFAPAEIVRGAREAADELGVDVVLVGPRDQVGDALGLRVVDCTEVISMDEEGALAVRRKKDSSIVRAAELVRDGEACATVSAGNTGAQMAAALLRLHRLPGIARPCIAAPVPRPGTNPVVLCDAGANAECTADMLVQFAQMGAVFSKARFGTDDPTIGLLSIGEEPTKGTPLVKEVHERLAQGEAHATFYGNVEGRDLLGAPVDVVVTDGFTGNVALKTLEGALKYLFSVVLQAISTDEATKAAGDVLLPHLMPVAAELTPDAHGGAMLLGVGGVSVISHGSSSATAVKNALRVARDLADAGVVEALAAATGPS